MANIAPFRGLRFNPEKINKLEDVITPPYDVISAEDGVKFLEKNIYNMIQLDLRTTSQDGEEDTARYTQAKDLFEQWQKEGVLVRDEQPAIYLYYIDYTHPSGRRMTRKGLISLVGLAEFSAGIVKPHEKTFDAVISERMQLMDKCRAQFSKVFSIYPDDRHSVMSTLEQAREQQPICSVKDHLGNMHTLWRVTDTEAIDMVIGYFKDKSIYIADGHHRYTTALGCLKNFLKDNPDIPGDSPYNFIMMYLCAAEDEGLSVLPTHRLLKFPGVLTADDTSRKMQESFIVEEINGGSREILVAEVLSRMNEFEMTSPKPVFGMYHAREDRCFLLTMKEKPEGYSSLENKPVVLRNLDVVVLSELLMHQVLGLNHTKIVDEKLISYFSDPDEAIDVAVKKSIADDTMTPLLFLLNPTKVRQVTDVADQGEIMPHKSTYFYPKIMTGLLINKLVAGEKIYMAG
ncbi:MAG: DUF1015 domain-containing protein [Desulfobulbaceae bacterium]|nr:DUF1015 domain-containing protein [Desulfobulbaceae bacterium]